jgi:hypothetical protein
VTVSKQSPDAIVRQTRWITVDMAKVADYVRIEKYVIKAALSRDPDATLPVLNDRSDTYVAETIGSHGIDDEPLVVPVITCEPARGGAYPQNASGVSQQRLDEIVG